MKTRLQLTAILICMCGFCAAPAQAAAAVWVKPVLQVVIPAVGRKIFGAKPDTKEDRGAAPDFTLIKEHLDMTKQRVDVIINNGFAVVDVYSTFSNPNSIELEARYRLPLPEHAVLSEFSIIRGEDDIQDGEVVAKKRAREIYEEEKRAGRDAGLAEKDSYRWFEFYITRVPANGTITMRHRYYQPLSLDHGIGRFVFPRESGQTDTAAAQAFWSGNVATAQSSFHFNCTVRSAWPLSDVRLPGHEDIGKKEETANEEWKLSIDEPSTKARDVVVYYRLENELPGRLEIIPYKPDADKPGYFMMLLTPGVDLKPLLGGTDYTFVLDVSGSMNSKLGVLIDGVRQSLGRLREIDRFRVITFNSNAHEVVHWTAATEAGVADAIRRIEHLPSGGGTNMYAGMQSGLNRLNADRPSAVILVTDGVTNEGVTSPKAFYKLSQTHDVRLFSFLLGNSANWPLMDVISKGSGGVYTSVSNQDDIIGQILLAKERMTRECLHHATLHITGARTWDTTDGAVQKIYNGQQLVFFGRYADGGEAEVILEAKLSGEDKRYQTHITLPDVAVDYPELERLWAMHRIEDLQRQVMIGKATDSEAKDAQRDLGIQYQIVTDQTSMLVLNDEGFERHGINRNNKQRMERERAAQQQRQQAPVANHRVDTKQPMFNKPARRISFGGGGGGGGAIEHWLALLICCGFAVLWWRRSDADARP